MKRLFIATTIKLDENYLQLRRQLKARTNYDSIVWVEDALQHITLRFLGKTPDEKIPLVIEMLKKTAVSTSAFSMVMDKLGVFGSRYAPTTIWLGFNQFDP
ncbi:MAG: 2'-5' RNA ligase family protein, partial [Bacteroidales bacterium]